MKRRRPIIAIAIIADKALARSLRLSHIDTMNTEANAVIDHLGGTTAVSRMIVAPVSTVHSWRKTGIPASRLAHLRLASREAGAALPDDLSEITVDWVAKRQDAAA